MEYVLEENTTSDFLLKKIKFNDFVINCKLS